MRPDASLGVEGGSLRNAGETARAAKALGFAGVWTSETKHDAFLPLGEWTEMPKLVNEEMLRAFAVEARPNELGVALRERYTGLADRVAPNEPFVPGEKDAFWRTLVEGITGV